MTEKYPNLYQSLRVLGIILLLGLYLWPSWFASSFFLVGLLAILFLGIPHGATDYLIFKNLKQPFLGTKKLLFFYLNYLAIMLLYAATWIIAPVVGLSIFLIISIFHFGQSNWVYIFPKITFAGLVTYTIWGTFVLFIPIFAHYDTALPVIEAISPSMVINISLPIKNTLISIIAGLALLNIIFLYFLKLIERKNLINELINLFLLGLALYKLPLWLGFAFYFAGWHSLTSIQEQIGFFKNNIPSYNWLDYLKNTAGLTFVSLVGILGLIYWSGSFDDVNILRYLFIFISVVTFPHMLLIHQLYKDKFEKTH